jgi:hydrogenase 3 maturation protease
LHQRLAGAERIAVLGVGSELRADDSAGLLVAQRIKEQTEAGNSTTSNFEHHTSNIKIQVFLGGTAPENLTGEIKRFHPTHLVIIDAADLDAEPGTITIMDPDSIGGTTFCTHSLPLKVMIDYLLDSCDCHVTIIGIQPKSLEVEGPISKEVLDAVESLAAGLVESAVDL